MNSEALLFIPDISGFTKFMTQCKLEHSNQIVFNLVDIILDSNQIGLKLSEIEGDAVLFYLNDGVPEKGRMIQQAKKTFMDFHNHLKHMNKDLFCNCSGACKTASDLTLKFIVHYGACKEVPFNGFMKLIGSDVILAHRLLKTTVPDREYILFSENYLNRIGPEENKTGEEWIVYQSHSEHIQDFGIVDSQYISLSPLRNTMDRQMAKASSRKALPA